MCLRHLQDINRRKLISTHQDKTLLIDLTPLSQVPRIVPPLEQQLPNESQKFWASVTTSIKEKRFTEATRLKQELEEKQRQKAAARKENGEEWRPRFFIEPVTEPGSQMHGRPELSEEGKKALEGLQANNLALKESEVTGA